MNKLLPSGVRGGFPYAWLVLVALFYLMVVAGGFFLARIIISLV
jgi:hypothetical protein